MSHSCSLDTQTSKIFCVVNIGKPVEDIQYFRIFFELYASTYAFIIHDKDVNEDGTIKPIHYHFVCNLKDSYKKQRLSTTLNKLASILHVNDTTGIQIEKYDSFEKCLQYLTHKNDSRKYQYKENEIITNLSQTDFDLYYNLDIDKPFTFDFIYSTCKSCNSKKDVIMRLWVFYSRDVSKQRLINEIWDIVSIEKKMRCEI